MEREIVGDYLRRSGMEQSQAGALSRILAEMGTRTEIMLIHQKFDALDERFDQKLIALEHKIEGRLERLKGDLTWRLVASTAFLAGLMTLLDLFID